MNQAERRFVPYSVGGHCPFRGLDAPLALVTSLVRSTNLVKS
jgi:hypothetical protein